MSNQTWSTTGYKELEVTVDQKEGINGKTVNGTAMQELSLQQTPLNASFEEEEITNEDLQGGAAQWTTNMKAFTERMKRRIEYLKKIPAHSIDLSKGPFPFPEWW